MNLRNLKQGKNYIVFSDFKSKDGIYDKNKMVMYDQLQKSSKSAEVVSNFHKAFEIQQDLYDKGWESVIAEVFIDQMGGIRPVNFNVILFEIEI